MWKVTLSSFVSDEIQRQTQMLETLKNKNKYKNDVKKLRRNNPFELFIVENEKRFLNITKRRIAKFRSKKDTKKNKNKKNPEQYLG